MRDSTWNLILTGFMGTGKSTVGRVVATRLSRPFTDMDAEIERRAGQSIPAIFATQGEAAFRQMERALCLELAAQRGLVIATGGGALLDPTSRQAMLRSGLVICLTATPEALLKRLGTDRNRPLLQAPDPTTRLRELLDARAEAYATLPHHIDTSALSIQETVEAVLSLWHTQCT